MYRMRMRLSVDLDIYSENSNQAFETLEKAKKLIFSTTHQELRKSLGEGISVRNVFTDDMLEEETTVS